MDWDSIAHRTLNSDLPSVRGEQTLTGIIDRPKSKPNHYQDRLRCQSCPQREILHHPLLRPTDALQLAPQVVGFHPQFPNAPK